MAKYIMLHEYNDTVCSCSEMRDECVCPNLKEALDVLSGGRNSWWG